MHVPIRSGALLKQCNGTSYIAVCKGPGATALPGSVLELQTQHAACMPAQPIALLCAGRVEHRIAWNVPTFTHLMKCKKSRTLHQAPLTSSDIQPRRHLLQH